MLYTQGGHIPGANSLLPRQDVDGHDRAVRISRRVGATGHLPTAAFIFLAGPVAR